MWEQYREGYPLRKDFPLRGRFSRSEQLRQALAANPEARYSMEELSVADAFEDLPQAMQRAPAVRREGGGIAPCQRPNAPSKSQLSTTGLDAQGRPVTGSAGGRRRTERRSPWSALAGAGAGARGRAHAHQHRPAASGHARRAPAGARARRRNGGALHPARRLSALRVREDRGVPPVQPDHPLDRPRGLPELARQQRGVTRSAPSGCSASRSPSGARCCA